MQTLYALLIVLVVIALVGAGGFQVQGYNLIRTGGSPAQKRWWMDSASALEPFVGSAKEGVKQKEGIMGQQTSDPIMEYAPGKPAPVDLYRNDPYHLLSDVLGSAREDRDSLSSVNSRSCYATDAEAYLSKVGNYRQLTNNYKREYPDNCSSTRQELVLNFYKAEPISVSR